MDSRKREEAHFHDELRDHCHVQRWSPEAEEELRYDPRWSNLKWYSIERRSYDFVTRSLEQRVPGKRVLDYCCGNGDDVVRIARLGAERVVGIDLSPTSIENARVRAREEGISHIAEYEVMDAEALEFPDESFDLVHVYGALHHMDFDKAMHEISRVLNSDGALIATEALKHNPLIHRYRRRTPAMRTDWEVQHILSRGEVVRASRYFHAVDVRFFHLASLAAVPLRRSKAFGPALAALEAVDQGILRIPGLRWWAWMGVFTMEGPRR